MKINVDNKDDVQKKLDAVQSRCTARTIDYEDITLNAKRAERKLGELGIKQKARKGCSVHMSPSRVTNSYRYPAEGTYARLERGSRDWFLVSAGRGYTSSCAYGASGRDELVLSDSAIEALPTRYEI